MRSRKSRQSLWSLGGGWGFGRALLAISLLVAGAGSMAYAVLLSQPAVLKGNSIQTGVASLQVSQDGINFTNSLNGYFFGGLIPGGQAMPLNGDPIYLKNAGNTALNANLTVPSGFSNPNNLDLSKVHLILSPIGGGAVQNYTLQSLVDGPVQLTGIAGHMIINQVAGYTMQIQLDSDAVNGPSANLSNLEFDFGATAVN